MNEAHITINGTTLDLSQSATLRCAVTNWHSELLDPERREEFEMLGAIGPLYVARLEELLALLISRL